MINKKCFVPFSIPIVNALFLLQLSPSWRSLRVQAKRQGLVVLQLASCHRPWRLRIPNTFRLRSQARQERLLTAPHGHSRMRRRLQALLCLRWRLIEGVVSIQNFTFWNPPSQNGLIFANNNLKHHPENYYFSFGDIRNSYRTSLPWTWLSHELPKISQKCQSSIASHGRLAWDWWVLICNWGSRTR